MASTLQGTPQIPVFPSSKQNQAPKQDNQSKNKIPSPLYKPLARLTLLAPICLFLLIRQHVRMRPCHLNLAYLSGAERIAAPAWPKAL